MGRSIATADFGDQQPARHFVYSDTTECALAPLFDSAEHARAAYETRFADFIGDSADQDVAYVVKLRHPTAHSDRDHYALATRRQLLWAGEDVFHYHDRTLLRRGGVLHSARTFDGGFDGQWPEPICAAEHGEGASDVIVQPEELFGEPVDLCRDCLRVMLRQSSPHRQTQRDQAAAEGQ